MSKVQDVSVTGKAMPMAVSPDRRFLFVALRTEPYSIASFAIDGANGTLTHLGNAPAPNSAPYISTDRTGRFLLGAYNPEAEPAGRRTGWISVSAIGPHGHVQRAASGDTHAAQDAFDPAGPFQPFRVRGELRRRRDGALCVRRGDGLLNPDPLPPVHVQPKAGPRHFVFHPNYRFMYLLNEYDGSLYSYGYDARNGALSEIQVSSTVPPDFDKERVVRAADIHLTPDGKWLYASGRASADARHIPGRCHDGSRDAGRSCSRGQGAARLQHRSVRTVSARGGPAGQHPDLVQDRFGDRRA